MPVYTCHTVHVVPAENRGWTVVDLQRRRCPFRSMTAALEYAKSIASTHQPSQVILLSTTGTMETVAHYRLLLYQIPETASDRNNTSLFDTTVKALVIGGLVAAGVAVLKDVVDTVQRHLKRASTQS